MQMTISVLGNLEHQDRWIGEQYIYIQYEYSKGMAIVSVGSIDIGYR